MTPLSELRVGVLIPTRGDRLMLLAQFLKEAGLKFFTAHQFVWFLSKGFDLFGLIDKGLAIDATVKRLNTRTNGKF